MLTRLTDNEVLELGLCGLNDRTYNLLLGIVTRLNIFEERNTMVGLLHDLHRRDDYYGRTSS